MSVSFFFFFLFFSPLHPIPLQRQREIYTHRSNPALSGSGQIKALGFAEMLLGWEPEICLTWIGALQACLRAHRIKLPPSSSACPAGRALRPLVMALRPLVFSGWSSLPKRHAKSNPAPTSWTSSSATPPRLSCCSLPPASFSSCPQAHGYPRGSQAGRAPGAVAETVQEAFGRSCPC